MYGKRGREDSRDDQDFCAVEKWWITAELKTGQQFWAKENA